MSRIEWQQSPGNRLTGTPATLALELPHDVDEFEQFTRTAAQRQEIKMALLIDQISVVAWMVFFAIFAGTVRNERTAIVLAALVAVTFSFDLVEKGAIRELFTSIPARDLAAGVSAILGAASLKYLGSFSIIYSVSHVLSRRPRTWERGLGLLFRTSAAAGMFGAAASFLSASARPIVAAAIDVAGIAIVVLIAASAWEVCRLRYSARLAPDPQEVPVS